MNNRMKLILSKKRRDENLKAFVDLRAVDQEDWEENSCMQKSTADLNRFLFPSSKEASLLLWHCQSL